MELKQRIRDEALKLGFDAVGFCTADAIRDAGAQLAAFLAAGFHGDMGWMETTADRRGHPNDLWPEAKSVVVVGMNYGPRENPLAQLERCDEGAVSVYAQGRDYHDVVKGKLKQLASWMAAKTQHDVKAFVDTAPVMEKPIAQAAGIGWQGKHTNLVSRDLGSWLFLGSIFTTLALNSDAPDSDHCGSCQACLDICPTRAFPAPYQLDARRCISYLTIEHKGHIARELRPLMGNRIYGCDDCLSVCPWNKFASAAREPAFAPRPELTSRKLADLSRLDDQAFRKLFSGSSVKRIGRDRFVRNVLIAIGNSGDSRLAPCAEQLLSDPSPLVRAMAVWAINRLLPRQLFEQLRSRLESSEGDDGVQREWREALN